MEYLNESTYVDQAERVIHDLSQPFERDGREIRPQMITTSKIRNILSMAADIYDNALKEPDNTINGEVAARIEYLRVRMIYEAGRDNVVKRFLDKAKLLDYVKMIGTDKKKYILFYRYMEALVAFHRFNGGKDN